MFQCDSTSQVRKGGTSGFRGILCYPSTGLGDFLTIIYEKGITLKISNKAESNDCVEREASVFLIPHLVKGSAFTCLCLFFLSMLTCLNLISLIF